MKSNGERMSIDKLKNLNSRMKTAISELERLEAGDDFLDAIAQGYSEIVRKCEDEREFIQRRKYR